MPFQPTVTNKPNGLPYIGVTSNLIGRIHQHREGTVPGFTQKYRLKRLVYFEQLGTMELAIAREKQLINWHRPWKVNLIETANPNWCDLAEDFGFEPLP